MFISLISSFSKVIIKRIWNALNEYCQKNVFFKKEILYGNLFGWQSLGGKFMSCQLFHINSSIQARIAKTSASLGGNLWAVNFWDVNCFLISSLYRQDFLRLETSGLLIYELSAFSYWLLDSSPDKKVSYADFFGWQTLGGQFELMSY